MRFGSDVLTPVFVGGVRVQVTPQYLPEHSDPDSDRYVFAYRVRITNECDRALQLMTRRWEIVDADSGRKVVEGAGVVGEQPLLMPGQGFDYSSGCELATPWGTMEGTYSMRTRETSGEMVTVKVGRFYLAPLDCGPIIGP